MMDRYALVGEGHKGTVGRLLARLSDIQAGEDVPRVVILEAESGAGKSRVIREVYDILRRGQPVNDAGDGYWPAPAESGAASVPGREARPVRKVLGQSARGFQRPAGTLPSFFWWPVACDEMPDGSIVDVVSLLMPQVQAHFRFMAMAWRERAGSNERFTAWVRRNAPTEARDIGVEGGLEALGQVLDAVNVALPGAGYVLTSGVRGAQALRERRRVRADVATGGGLDEPQQTAQMIYEQLSRVMLPDLPTVVVVEDMHLMGEGLADLLDFLAQPVAGKPVLVIGTAWPEALGHREVYDRWRGAAVDVGVAQVWDLPDLEKPALIDLARSYVPNSDPTMLDLLVSRWSNPYALILLLTDPRVQRSGIRDGSLILSAAELDRLPRSIEGLYQRRWEELPREVQEALMVAVGCLPSDVLTDPQLHPFIRAVVADTAALAGLTDVSVRIPQALGFAVDPHQWSRMVAQDADQFGEWVLARVAKSAADDEFGDLDLTQMAVSSLSEWITGRAGDGYQLDIEPVNLAAARWLLALTAGSDPTAITAIAAWAVAREAASTHQYERAIATVADHLGVLGPDHPDTLRTRHNIAAWTGQTGHPDQALTLYSDLLTDQQRILGPDHPDTLRTRNNIAAWSKCLRLLESPRIDPDTPNAYLEVAISRTTYPEATAVLIAGCRRFGTHAMAAAAKSWDNSREAAWLLLVDSGYDPWQMTLYWQHPGAALGAAVTAVDETDEEDLSLILQLNPQIEQTHGTALRLLAGLNPDLPHDLQPVTASLTYLATWVAPNTPLAQRALTIRDHLQ